MITSSLLRITNAILNPPNDLGPHSWRTLTLMNTHRGTARQCNRRNLICEPRLLVLRPRRRRFPRCGAIYQAYIRMSYELLKAIAPLRPLQPRTSWLAGNLASRSVTYRQTPHRMPPGRTNSTPGRTSRRDPKS